jgi:hypothetical protein
LVYDQHPEIASGLHERLPDGCRAIISNCPSAILEA